MIFNSFVIAFALFIQLFHSNEAKWNFDEYKCAVCVPAVQYMIDHKEASFQQGCRHYFPEATCEQFNLDSKIAMVDIPRKSAHEVCQGLHVCSTKESYLADSTGVDIRVSRAIGSKGYNKARLSVISNSTISSPYFSYTSQFKYRWTNKYLNTGIVTLTPGEINHFSVAGKEIDIFLPKENVGTRGIVIADPCITSQWIVCVYQDKYQTFDHYTSLLNAINQRNDISFWQILGDNFYDQEGDASSSFFGALSDSTKSKFLMTTPGNHDFWVNSAPLLSVPKDQYGNGLMQFYGQDTLGASAATPFDFTINPDGNYGRSRGENIPPASNFFYYNKVGDIAFIGYSGAHNYATMVDYFTEACTWAASVNPKVVFLEGHWNEDGDGCETDATVPEVFEELKALPACAPIIPRLKYFMGHKHCNYVTQENVGYMVGGAGMSDKDCMGDFGFTVVDTVDGQVNVYYFPVAHASDYDNYDAILSCIQTSGLPGCYHLAQKWT